MKKLSLVTQSLITEFAYGLAFVLVGVVRMASDKGLTDFMPDWMVLIVRVLLVLLATAVLMSGGKLGSIMTIDEKTNKFK